MDEEEASAFSFEGSWRDYAPIAFTNLLLTIVTLGLYRFWATTRTRRYLWSNTRFIDERLEWTGTGKELLIGFLLVLVLLGIPLLILNVGVQALVIRGHAMLGGLIGIASFIALFYLGGLARYRALRYRLSRTFWHGIRGGSDNQGWGYGWSYMWKNVLGSLIAGLLIPWSMVSLWNERWSAMSFGPYAFEASALSGDLFKRFLLFYLLPILVIFGSLFMGSIFAGMAFVGAGQSTSPGAISVTMILGIMVFGILAYGGMGLVALAYYAKFFRVAVGGMSLSTLDFHFGARTKDWFKLILGDVALVICTLGIGSIFLSYRHWKFFIVNLEATGEIDLSALTQSTTREPGQGEGLLDAFDIGAI